MKLKKLIVLILVTTLALFATSIFNSANAATGSKYLKIRLLRESGFGYKVAEKNLWKIVETNSSGTTHDFNSTIYCLKGGPGFGSEDMFGNGTPTVRQYTRYFDMKDSSSIPSPYKDALPDVNSSTYKSLLWLLENIYFVPSNANSEEKQAAEEYRNQLLDAANLSGSYLTDEDIDAVQQLAVWHFTNDDEYDMGDNASFELWVNSIKDQESSAFNPLSDEVGAGSVNGWDRAEDAITLYNYLVDTATQKASSYEVKPASKPYELAKLTQSVKVEGSNYVIGPFKINKISDTVGTLQGTFKNGKGELLNPTLQNASGSKFSSLEDTIGKEFYIVLPTSTNIQEISFNISGSYYNTTITYWSVENAPEQDQPVVVVDRTKEDYEDTVTYQDKNFDLSLRKFISQVNDIELKESSGKYSREPIVDITPLTTGSDTTAIYKHPKKPVEVAVGDTVIYTIRVYNEGQVDGYVKEITDYLPENLEFVNDEFNAQYGWTISKDERIVKTTILSPDTEYSASRDTIYQARKEGSDKVILEAFDGKELDYIDVKIKCKVKDTAKADEKLTNIAEITDFVNSDKEEVIDRDSKEDNVTLPSDTELPNYKDQEINRGDEYIPGQQDDDDFDKVVIQKFDLALRKFITGVNENVISNREPVFSIVNGKYTYTHTKEPVEVNTGDTVIYTLRIYNEGDIDGYAEEVKDDIPDGLEFLPENTTNINYRWVMYDENGEVTDDVTKAVTIRTDYLSKDQETATGRDNLIKAFDDESMEEPDYKEVRIAFKVTEPNTSDRIIINTAEISEDANEKGDPIDDVDSTPDNDKDGEDDIDIEKVKVNYFDLALRKFITGVNETPITNRVPVFSIENGKYVYTHTKEPVEVSYADTVIYTLRIYNEGSQAGYAEEVKDDLPEGLEFLPDNSINTEHRWVMYDENGEVTEDVTKAVEIRTDYLSKEQEEATGRNNLLKGFDQETMSQPDYKDIKIAFKVVEKNTSDRILINTAEISEDADQNGDPVDDKDSTPDNNVPEEDDIDIEKVKVNYFDLALKKIITKVTMTLDGKTTVEETGHKFEDDPEAIVKVELGNHKIETSVIKFTYKIRITNEGSKAGYAYEVKDYIPEGLEFKAEDNKNWKLSEDGKTITTDQLKDKLLKPGESAEIEVTLRWINGQNNLGVKTNWAEISKDSDDDIDSTPDNFQKGEDDIDDASVILSVVTGVGDHYVGVIIAVLTILGTGIVLIKKYVI